MSLKGKRIALLLDHKFEDLEGVYPKIRLEEEGAIVDVVAIRHPETYSGKHGYPLKSTHSISEVSANDYDGVISPGGFCNDFLRRDERVVKFVEEINNQNKVVAAICHGAWILCSARKNGNEKECMLNGKKMTCFFAIKYDVINAGAEWIDEAVVVDGNLITSRTPDDLTPFCKAIISNLSQ